MVLEYIKEGYIRIIYSVYTFISCFCCGFVYREELLCKFTSVILELVGEGNFIYTGFGEVFIGYLWFCFILASSISLCIILLNIYLFLLPGLYEYEAKKVSKLLMINLITCLSCFSIIHNNILYLLCKYLIGYGGKQGVEETINVSLNFQPRFGETLNFLIKLDGLLLLLIGCIGLVICLLSISTENWAIENIRKWRKWVYTGLLLFIIIIFPADVILHLLVFTVLVIIFELGCFLLFIIKSYEFAWWNR